TIRQEIRWSSSQQEMGKPPNGQGPPKSYGQTFANRVQTTRTYARVRPAVGHQADSQGGPIVGPRRPSRRSEPQARVHGEKTEPLPRCRTGGPSCHPPFSEDCVRGTVRALHNLRQRVVPISPTVGLVM